MKKICDCHIHTSNSFDADNTLREICKEAIQKGIDIIAVTDHMEVVELPLGAKSQFGDMMPQIEKSAKDVDECREIFKDELKILKGIEIGSPMQDKESTKKAMSIAQFDFVLASIHNVKGYEDFYFIEFTNENIPVLLKLYFEELLDMAKNADFDSLAHLTYPLRYIVERNKFLPDLSEYQELIHEIFITLIKRKKALEINTSGLFKPIGTTLPSKEFIRRYKELGGEYITIGSDAHNCTNLGKGIAEGIKLAKECGFTHYTIFENRQPKLIEI